MKKSLPVGGLILVAVFAAFSSQGHSFLGLVGGDAGGATAQANMPAKPGKTMRAFASEAEFKEYFKKFQRDSRGRGEDVSTNSAADMASQPAPAAKSEAKSGTKDDESITNSQHAGVDEGGIVKVHGDHFVILRRGRLFTVKFGGNSLEPESSVNAYPPNINPNSDWYDEMLLPQTPWSSSATVTDAAGRRSIFSI